MNVGVVCFRLFVLGMFASSLALAAGPGTGKCKVDVSWSDDGHMNMKDITFDSNAKDCARDAVVRKEAEKAANCKGRTPGGVWNYGYSSTFTDSTGKSTDGVESGDALCPGSKQPEPETAEQKNETRFQVVSGTRTTVPTAVSPEQQKAQSLASMQAQLQQLEAIPTANLNPKQKEGIEKGKEMLRQQIEALKGTAVPKK